MSDAKIIKPPEQAGGSSLPTRTLLKRAVIEAEAEARQLLTTAAQQAAEIRAAAERDARELRESAAREGREAALLELHQLLLDAHERRDEALAEAERDLLRLAVKLAERIIGREIDLRDGTIAEMVATALTHARRQEQLTVRVHPADLAVVQAARSRLDETGRARFLEIIPDPRVARHGCIIESAAGAIDAQLDTQLRVLERALLETRHRKRSGE